MRFCCFLALGILLSCTLNAQTLFTYGKHKVSKDEFLKAFHKNNTTPKVSPEEVNNYLDLFVRFKLKVQAARDLKFDTLAQIKTDLRNFRQQVQDNYMVNEAMLDEKVKEAAQRSARELHVIHFSSPNERGTEPEKAINHIYQALKNGNRNFAELIETANGISPSAFQDVGYVTAFSVPYNFENILYSLKPGEVSEPYKTTSAWHVFLLEGSRPNSGTWKAAQILFSLPDNPTDIMLQQARHKADSVYGLLKGGMAFEEAARLFSEDKLSYAIGGELAPFTTGKYDPVFESNVYALKKDGDFSKPFRTEFGFHIVRRMHHQPFAGADDAAFLYDLRQRVLTDPRMDEAKDLFNKDVMKQTGLSVTREASKADLLRFADTVMLDLSAERFDDFPISNKRIIRFNNGSQTGADWLRFVRNYKANYELDKGETGEALWNKYVEQAALKNYRDHLEKFNEAFAFQIKEFEEGNLLFEVMEKNVWSKAAEDSAGLAKFYQRNKNNYKWAESYSLVSINAPDTATGFAAYQQLQSNKNLHKLHQDFPMLHIDSSRYELSVLNDLMPGEQLAPGYLSQVKEHADGSAIFYLIVQQHPAGVVKSFEEARGAVLSDYQQELEEAWMKTLYKKYPVKINQKEKNKLQVN